jgi:hypothetical protein
MRNILFPSTRLKLPQSRSSSPLKSQNVIMLSSSVYFQIHARDRRRNELDAVRLVSDAADHDVLCLFLRCHGKILRYKFHVFLVYL